MNNNNNNEKHNHEYGDKADARWNPCTNIPEELCYFHKSKKIKWRWIKSAVNILENI